MDTTAVFPFGSKEALECIIQMLPWYSIISISNVNSAARTTVQGFIRSRLHRFLTRFMEWDDVKDFCALLKETDAAIAGSLVRCLISIDTFDLYKDTNPLQLNVLVPNKPQIRFGCEQGTREFRQWRGLFIARGYYEQYGGPVQPAPSHLRATSCLWSVLVNPKYPHKKISIVQSRTRSALSPVLQSCHSSNFFALSATRIYSLYPKLFAAKVNIAMKDRIPFLTCAFDGFNHGLLSFKRTDDWEVFPSEGCGEACPSVWRQTKGLPGVAIFRWGGFSSINDTGKEVSVGDNFGDTKELWRLEGECNNQQCPNVFICMNLFHTIF